MFCKNCGNQIPDGAAFCTVCGASVNGTDAPMEVHEPVQLTHPMKWHKFLIYFQLFLAAILNALNGIGYFAAFFSDRSAIYIFRGVLCVVTAVLAIYVRFRLAGFHKNAPRVYSIFLGITCALQIISLIDSFGTGIYAVSSAVGALFAGVLMLVLNSIYYSKRADLFVN